MGQLTTHVLDTTQGTPAQGVHIAVYRSGSGEQILAEGTTNHDGRLDSPLLEGEGFPAGSYDLVFAAGDYFALNSESGSSDFLNQVVIRFQVSDANGHYHVPLLLSPYSYTTYRGS
jgi:5-hydroxyisourate hydrolase